MLTAGSCAIGDSGAAAGAQSEVPFRPFYAGIQYLRGMFRMMREVEVEVEL